MKNEKQVELSQVIVNQENTRLEGIRKEWGDRFWAESVGSTVASNLVLLNTPVDDLSVEVLKGVKQSVEEIERSPELAQDFIKGVRKELDSRRVWLGRQG